MIEVGDRVTYKNSMGNIRQVMIKDEEQKIKYLSNSDTYKDILKIERPKYEVVEEKKGLLTEEEREFLKDMCKYYDIAEIEFGRTESGISFYNEDDIVAAMDYPYNLEFQFALRNRFYTLKELGLEEN